MARVQIITEGPVIFTTKIAVRITDLNYGNHLGNDALMTIMHEARMQFLAHLGYTELNIEGCSIIMADAAIQYKSEAFYADVLSIRISLGGFTSAGFDMFYEIDCGSRSVAIAKTGLVFYDYLNKKIKRLPAAFHDKIQG